MVLPLSQEGRCCSAFACGDSILWRGFIVQDGGRKRLLREKRKNVHAFAHIDHGLISKDLAGWAAFADTLHGKIEVSYNPYRGGSFYRKDTGADVQRADALIMLAPLDAAPIVWAIVDL